MQRTFKLVVATIGGIYFLALIANLSEVDGFALAAEAVVSFLLIAGIGSLFVFAIYATFCFLSSVFVEPAPTKTGQALRALSKNMKRFFK